MSTEKWRNEHKEELKKYRRKWYSLNKKHAKNEVVRRKKEIRNWFSEYKSHLFCVKCGETNYFCLTFHHKDKKSKFMEISDMMVRGYSIKKIKEEILKCECLCLNCHAKVHRMIA